MINEATGTTYTDDSLEEEDSLDDDGRPPERWAPLGAVATPEPDCNQPMASNHEISSDEMKKMQEEQEQLNSSLLALTSHFAQVQFRLKQIVSAEDEDKESLLRELEEFAFRGIPDVRGCKVQDANFMEALSDLEHEAKINEQRQKQLQLIEQLKAQLEDLELYAYETGDYEQPPTSRVMEKQRVIIDQLKHKLDLDLDNFETLSTDQLRQAVDSAIGQIVNPAKVKEKLVDQLKTQISDLERFIEFLQGVKIPGERAVTRKSGELPTVELETYHHYKCTCCSACPLHAEMTGKGNAGLQFKSTTGDGCNGCENAKANHRKGTSPENNKHLRDMTTTVLRRAVAVLQMFASSQLGCGGSGDDKFRSNILKRTDKGNHWGDLRAKVELAIANVLEQARIMEAEQLEKLKWTAENHEDEVFEEEYHSDSEEYMISEAHKQLILLVRKEMCPALKDLMEHGLYQPNTTRSLIPLVGCLSDRPNRRTPDSKKLHAWDIFLRFYEMKHGKEYNESPARKLSQSFDLDIIGGKAITSKQQLLSAVGTVLQSHETYKRSEDSQFKALICLALNEKKLSTWLRLIVKNPSIVDFYYHPWSYTSKTGFDDTLHALNRLNKVNFKLPFDLAVRHFNNIKDAF